MNKKAQQEIAGFVLIVVVVVIGLVVYLGITLRSNSLNEDSAEVDAILDSLLKHTTECAVTYVPNYEDFRGLFKSAYEKKFCSNLNDKPAIEYLNESLKEVLSVAFSSESSISGYEIQFFVKEPPEGILQIKSGNVTRNQESAISTIASGSKELAVTLKIYRI
jgi:hypothetical protein